MPADLPTESRLNLGPTDIVGEVKHLPSSPKVLPRLKLMLQNGNSELREIVALVRLDQALAVRALQIANSPYFFTGARCLTIEEAVARVGYDEIYKFVAHAAAMEVVHRPVAVYRMESDQMWGQAVCCAIASEALAERVGVDRAAAYTLGLLHGVGMVAIDEWALRTGTSLKFAIHPFPCEATRSERAYFGFTQADVGAALLESWDFPVAITDPVRFQYAPASATSWGALAALLTAARWIRSAVLSPSPNTLPPLPSPAQIRPAGLKSTALTDSIPLVSCQFRSVASSLMHADEPAIDRHSFPSLRWRPAGAAFRAV